MKQVGQLPLNQAILKHIHPKMSVRTRVLQSGTGYTHDATNRYKPMFHITLDGYLEYYNSALLKKYQIYDPNKINELRDLPNGSNTAFTPYSTLISSSQLLQGRSHL